MGIITKRHSTQIDTEGNLLPNWPYASHFANWDYEPHTVNGKSVDLYYTLNAGELLIGLQFSDEDGDYQSPFIESENALHSIYLDRSDVKSAYLKACSALGISPKVSRPYKMLSKT